MKIYRCGVRNAFKFSLFSSAMFLSCMADAVTIAGTDLSISGRVVAGVDVTTGIAKADGTESTVVRAASNQWGTSMLTLAAEHALSGGAVGFATLETGFGANNGQTNDGTFWSRRAFVGIKSKTWGSLQFGKNLSISNSLYDFDPMGQNTSSSPILVGGRNWNLATGAIEYWSPDVSGAGVGLQYSPGTTVGNAKANRKVGIDVFYSAGPLKVHAIYDTAANANGEYDNVYSASKEYILGGTYQWGPTKLFVGYNRSSATDAATGSPTSAKQAWVGVNVQASEPLLLRAAIYSGGSNVDAQVAGYGGKRGTLLALGAEYSLDKQLMVWSTLAAVKNGVNSRFSSSNYWDSVPNAGKTQETLNVGLSYSF